ncbi:MAG: hypothetical protein JNK01_24950 [Devosia sp.]|jgi:hypothetical protein|nr:hypothetical protein [Devosia sp.]
MTIVKLGIAALAATVALAGAANAFDLKAGNPGKLVPTSIQLGIISPPDNICPGNGKLTAWVETNKPGTINILVVKKGGAVGGPYAVTTVKGANGIVMGSYTQNLVINNPVDAEYRVVVAGTPIQSNWVPLLAEC